MESEIGTENLRFYDHVPTASEKAGTEIRDSVLNTLSKYGLGPTHLALLSLIDEIHEL